jgi:hypothetical protein
MRSPDASLAASVYAKLPNSCSDELLLRHTPGRTRVQLADAVRADTPLVVRILILARLATAVSGQVASPDAPENALVGEQALGHQARAREEELRA